MQAAPISWISILAVMMMILHSVGCQERLSMHSLHLSETYPDDPRLMLSNLARIANAQIHAAKGRKRTFTTSDTTAPYTDLPKCDPSTPYRTINGTCNNLYKPWNGAAKTPLTRLTHNKYQDGVSDARKQHFHTESKLPHARHVSLSINLIRSNLSTKHNHLLMSFGQFIDHDLTLSPESGAEGGEEAMKEQCCNETKDGDYTGNRQECFPLMTEDDPVFNRSCIPFLRSAPVPALPGTRFERYQMNDLTSWIDGSQIYGSTLLKSKQLRSFVNGKLRTEREQDGSEGLPHEEHNPSNCPVATMPMCSFLAGDVRSSEQAGLTSMHTVFLREHNRIASVLTQLNPHWNDEHTYQVARKIVGGIMQRITYEEWLPAVLGPKLMEKFKLRISDRGRFYGYSIKHDASILTEFSTAAFRFGHSLVRQTFSHSDTENTDISDMFKSFNTLAIHGTDSFLKGMLKDKVETCDRFIAEGLRNNLFNEELDLMALNIQRGRDHGLNSYNEVRRLFGLPVHTGYDNMAGDSHSHTTINAMKLMYPHPEDVELFVGGISEEPLPGGVVGETFGHIIAEQFRRLKYADRFWHETADKNLGFDHRQLDEIRKASFALIFCENIPGVKVQRSLLWIQSESNPTVRCDSLPSIDLTAWQQQSHPHPTKSSYTTPTIPGTHQLHSIDQAMLHHMDKIRQYQSLSASKEDFHRMLRRKPSRKPAAMRKKRRRNSRNTHM